MKPVHPHVTAPRRRCITPLLLCWMAAALPVAGCSPNALVERRVEQAMPSAVAPARQWKARLQTTRIGMQGLNARSLLITGTEVEIRPGLVLDNLKITLTGLRVTLQQQVSAESGQFTASLGSASLQHYLAGHIPDIGSPWNTVLKRFENPRVAVEKRGVRLTIDAVLPLGLKASAELVGRGRIRDGGIWLETTEIRALGIPLPGMVRDAIAEHYINRSLVDFQALGAPVTPTAVGYTQGALLLEGTVDVSRLNSMAR